MISYLLPQKAATVQTLGHPAAGVIGWVDGSQNTTGVTVSRDTALSFAAVWCATRVISETIATLPCLLYRRRGDDSRERFRDDPRYWLISEQPHPEMSSVTFFETMTANMVLHGNCYAIVRREADSTINRLHMRSPETVRVELAEEAPYYDITDPREIVQSDSMLHVPGLGGDGITGWSVIRYAAQSIGAGIAADQYAGGQWGNGATPAGVLTHPMRLDKPAREHLRREWEEVHRGSNNAHKVAIMHGGMEFKPISMSNEDAQFLESRQFSIREIARWFRLPPHMLADLADSSVRANIEQQAIEFIIYSLKPWLTRWQQTLNRKLLGEDERREMYFEFLLESLLQGDSAAQAQAWSVGRQWGWYSVNDIRKFMNLPPVDGGDVYLQPSNMMPADSEMASGEKPEPAPQMLPEEEPEESEEDGSDEEEVPKELARELRGNLTSSLAAIMETAKGLRESIETGAATVSDSMSQADHRMTGSLESLRQVRDEIRRDMQSERKQQIQGCDRHLVDATHALLHEHLRCGLRVEKADVAKAAKCVVRGANFCEWVGDYYGQYPGDLAKRIKPATDAYRTLRMTADFPHLTLAESYCRTHELQLLQAADGNRKQFMDRVQSVIDGWDDEITHVRMGD